MVGHHSGREEFGKENNDDEQLHKSSIVWNIGMDGGIGRVFPGFGISVSPPYSGLLQVAIRTQESYMEGRSFCFCSFAGRV